MKSRDIKMTITEIEDRIYWLNEILEPMEQLQQEREALYTLLIKRLEENRKAQ